ncbi:3-oxoacyl-ACP synthase III family protein [Prauserella endophytica]|uniref:3-oxoacyl-ACP synthase III family protein n=1 Tax=Prauserella endophytica TaxID=1592324 RepID=A0ABY2RU14_9PSEU|nr:3-oxoacyl-ACP synthase III family protein [Prauserella endophytica]TKG60512.1 3-oxoacyl-ACP synthase III family protein [Prauserella endophytica]
MNHLLLGSGIALPGEPIDNVRLGEKFGTDPRWVERFIGTRTRHLGVDLDTGKPTHTLVDLAAEAGAAAIADAGLEPADIDLVVLATASPDHLMPASVNLVADRLVMQSVPTYQLQSGCAGAVQALALARRMLDDEHATALVIGGDSCAKHLVLDHDFPALPPSELVNYVIFGDGAGAVVLARSEEESGTRLGPVCNTFVGLGRDPGQVIRWFGAADRDSGEQPVDENYKAIEADVPTLAGEMLTELLDRTGWPAESITHLMPPQLGGRMTEHITAGLLDRFGLTAREISCVADTGNNGNALPFLQLHHTLPLAPGDRALAVAIESSKWIRTGFALEGL